MTREPLVVTCRLAGPLAGDPPMLCGLILDRWLILRGLMRRVTRSDAAPDVLRSFAADRFPVGHTVLGGYVVPHCSIPILAAVRDDRHEYYHKRFPVADAVRLCDPSARGVVPTTMTVTKSYRLPNRVRTTDRLAWVCEGNARELRKVLGDVTAVGKDRGMGYGAVAVESWDVRQAPDLHGAWWYAGHPAGMVLMRPLPAGDWLPPNLIGARRDYAACSPPYWHRDRLCEAVTPC